jgi:hypothetical protein
VQTLLDEARLTGVVLDRAAIALQMSDALTRMVTRVVATPFERGILGTLLRLVDVAEAYDVDMWMVQNNYNVLWQRDYPTQQQNADAGDVVAMDWVADFRNLGEHLNMAIVNE